MSFHSPMILVLDMHEGDYVPEGMRGNREHISTKLGPQESLMMILNVHRALTWTGGLKQDPSGLSQT